MTDTHPTSDIELVRRYRSGDQQAANLLYQKYAQRIRALAKSRCGRLCAGRFDPDDVVQSVFCEVFAKISDVSDEFADGGKLWGLMIVMTLNKVRTLVEYHSAAKRSVARTISCDSEESPLDPVDPRSGDPMLRYVLNEQLGRLPNVDRQIVKMRLEGYEITEIVVKTGRPRRTIERVLNLFREHVKSIL